MRSIRARAGLAAAAAVALAAGCSPADDVDTDAAAGAVPPVVDATDDEPTDEGSATDAGDEDTVVVRLVDFTFEDLPATVPAGTQLSIVNESENELHELAAIRLPDDEDRSIEELLELPPEELEGSLAPPSTVLLAAPGGEQIPAVGDGTLDEPGRYAVICVIPTGIDPQVYLDAAGEAAASGEEGPPEVEGGGPPHIAQGMFAELTVE